MECLLTGNQIKDFHRAVNCLARIGNELVIEAIPEKLIFRTLNPSRSAFLAITFKAQFFDAYKLFVPVAQCSVLLKAVCTVFRVAPSSMERLAIILPDTTSTKLQWTLECLHGIRKTYWITCINEPDMQHVALDRKGFLSHLIVKPRDLNRLLANFQSSLQEITLIATEASPMSPTDSGTLPEGKAVELRSYIDPVKEKTDAALHTQLWIDPAEELQEYVHRGPAVDVTFSVKELKAFLAFCEGCEADMHFFFERAGSPILLAPRFGLDDSDHAEFDATLVLATMLGSQLRESECNEEIPVQAVPDPLPTLQGNGSTEHGDLRPKSSAQVVHRQSLSTPRPVAGESDHTRIWSELSGSAAKTLDNSKAANEHAHQQASNDASEEIPIVLPRRQSHDSTTNQAIPSRSSIALYSLERGGPDLLPHLKHKQALAAGDKMPSNSVDHNILSRNPNNWLSADTDEEEDEADADDLFVQSTPPQRRGLL